MSLPLSKKEAEKAYVAALLAVQGIGRASLAKIQRCCQELQVSLAEFWRQQPAQIWEISGLNFKQQAALRLFKKNWTPESYFGWLREQKIQLISPEDNNYPKLLKNIDDKPPILYVKGRLIGQLERPIAVVGTRQISGYGRAVIEWLVPALIAHQCTIISGFMYGVDVTAQTAAMAAEGKTVGVLGFGFEEIFPASQQSLFEKMIAQKQCFLSEYPPWVGAHRGNFPERNRIVAGMSLATVVIEAASDSGSHITARLAGEYGRGVCAVPGSIFSPYSEGTKSLINQGARLVSTAREILEEAGILSWAEASGMESDQRPELGQPNPAQLKLADDWQRQVYHQLQTHSQTSDELADALALPINQLQGILSELELNGFISREGFDWQVRR